MIKLVTFDVNGTLLKLKKPIGVVYSEVGNKFGIQADPALLSDCFIENYRRLSEEHYNFGRSSGLGWENWWRHLVSSTFTCASTGSISDGNIRLIQDELLCLFNTREGWSVQEGARDLLTHLRERNVKLGVISNFDPRLKNILNELCLTDYFSFITASYECESMKPDTAIFSKAAEMFLSNTSEKLDPKRTIHVGDSVELDYFGAKNAGWKAVIVSHDTDRVEFQGLGEECLFRSLKDLKKKLLLDIC